jgi:hypothetical protein
MTINESLKAAWERMWGKEAADEHARELEQLLRPQEIAVLVTYLASEAADHINGCIFEVWRGHVGIYPEPLPVAGVLWKDGSWTPEELAKAMPGTITAGLTRELPPSGFSAHT